MRVEEIVLGTAARARSRSRSRSRSDPVESEDLRGDFAMGLGCGSLKMSCRVLTNFFWCCSSNLMLEAEAGGDTRAGSAWRPSILSGTRPSELDTYSAGRGPY